MTTRGYEVNLDRLLTRERIVPGEPLVGSTYRYDVRAVAIAEDTTPSLFIQGHWAGIGHRVWLYETDADGVAIPEGDSITLDSTSMVVFTGDGGYTFTTVLTGYTSARDPLTIQPIADTRRLSLHNDPQLPDTGDITVTLPTGGLGPDVAIEQKVWCGLRDFTGRDQINISSSGAFFELSDTRVLVRADDTWAVGDTFTLDGDNYAVRGIARVGGRKQYLELLSRGG